MRRLGAWGLISQITRAYMLSYEDECICMHTDCGWVRRLRAIVYDNRAKCTRGKNIFGHLSFREGCVFEHFLPSGCTYTCGRCIERVHGWRMTVPSQTVGKGTRTHPSAGGTGGCFERNQGLRRDDRTAKTVCACLCFVLSGLSDFSGRGGTISLSLLSCAPFSFEACRGVD